MKAIQSISMLSLALFICSGTYGIVISIYYTNEYSQLTDVTITAGTMIFNYLLGSSRGIATVICGILGVANLKKKEVRTRYLVFLGILTLMYLLGLTEYPYIEEFIKMSTAVFCISMLSIFKFIKYPMNISLQNKSSPEP